MGTARAAMNSAAARLKLHCFHQGIVVSPDAESLLSAQGERPLTLHEYATTGGVTLRLGDIYINAPFDDWYCRTSEAVLDVTPDGSAFVRFEGDLLPCEVLPLPGYLEATNERGEPVTRTTMSHTDRIRVSPLAGCVLDCAFCDMPALRYHRHDPDEVLSSLAVARADQVLPVSHLLISGGSPGPRHFEWWDDTVERIVAGAGMVTDVMMSPREGDLGYLGRFADAGADGFSFNLEIAGDATAERLMPRKYTASTPFFDDTVAAAVRLLGAGNGAVRSIVIVGLDDADTTVAAVERIARMGADPVLSPFRPARNTPLQAWAPPSAALLAEVEERSQAVVARHGVLLGPRCIPCQHNTLTFPEGGGYYYSDEVEAAHAR